MRNLAGVKDCDREIRNELIRCGIDVVEGEKSSGEVPYSITGKLGNFTFHRAWYYWVVTGDLPLNVARKLYDNVIGKKDIRVNGNCTCPAPEEFQIKWLTSDSKRVWTKKDETMIESLKDSPETYASIKAVTKDVIFDDERNESKYNGFIEQYHIDSELGLYLFAQAVKDTSPR